MLNYILENISNKQIFLELPSSVLCHVASYKLAKIIFTVNNVCGAEVQRVDKDNYDHVRHTAMCGKVQLQWIETISREKLLKYIVGYIICEMLCSKQLEIQSMDNRTIFCWPPCYNEYNDRYNVSYYVGDSGEDIFRMTHYIPIHIHFFYQGNVPITF